MYVFDLVIDYVQVVDMGTLELRITAAKPGADGKLVKKKKSPYDPSERLSQKNQAKICLLHSVWVTERAQV